ncbi:hypothetical protein L1987_07040 [Smallanthus sonchifolius]|uniref:Uncharacterized protein n=1 Tax=Smallanthus sonchifolius TaxID=185202 RepID=A0ACB9JZZ5_9ASTR|nr:hypothetical protein L1987_07040 [Smallanthus sonchifolius]
MPSYIPTGGFKNRRRPVNVSNGMSYRDAVVKDSVPCFAPRKSITIDSDVKLYPKHVMGWSTMGEARDIQSLCNCRVMLDARGYKEAKILYFGGLKVMLVFKDDKQEMEFMQAKDGLWSKFLISTTLWSGQYIPFDRIAGLKVVGVPFQLRDNNTFDKVGELFELNSWVPSFAGEQSSSYSSSQMNSEIPNSIGEEAEEGEIVADDDSGGRPEKPPVNIDQQSVGNEQEEVEKVENLADGCMHGEGTRPCMVPFVDGVVPDSLAVGVGDGNLDEMELTFEMEETVRVGACLGIELQERRDQVRSL